VLGLGALALKFPLVALAVAIVLLALIGWFFVYLLRAARRRLRRPRDASHGPPSPVVSSPR
jgi:hypothetical protein